MAGPVPEQQHAPLAVETVRYTFRVLRSYNLVSRGVFTRSRACIDDAPNIPPLQASRALPKTLDRVLARTGVIAADVRPRRPPRRSWATWRRNWLCKQSRWADWEWLVCLEVHLGPMGEL